MKKTLIALILVAAMLCGTVALADYPDKPITLYCGYSAGGSSDLLCRILAAKLQEKIGQTIVVEDKTGGGGWVLWTEMIKNVAPDGYTFCLINTPNFSRSAYVAHVDPDTCVACGQCVENCPAGAIWMSPLSSIKCRSPLSRWILTGMTRSCPLERINLPF